MAYRTEGTKTNAENASQGETAQPTMLSLYATCERAATFLHGPRTLASQRPSTFDDKKGFIMTTTKRTPHPMLLAAGMALILFCAVGIAAVMGWIPSSIGSTADQAEVAVAEKAATSSEKPRRVWRPSTVLTAPIRVACANCGVIDSIRTIQTSGQGSGVGAVGGAVVGGLLGNQVGGGSGKDAMTVVGAIGGALAGNHIEKNVKSTTSYEIVVHMDDGSDRVIHEANEPSWRYGEKVKIVNGAIRSV